MSNKNELIKDEIVLSKKFEKMEIIIEDKFVLSKYFEKMEKIIKNILERTNKEVLTYDILDTEQFEIKDFKCKGLYHLL
jgi:lambda repressor-like predicted transcriptional regulator